MQLLQSNNYVVCSVGNGLFTTGGHFIVLTKLEGNTIQVYDPYLYAGKFETSTRRGKASVNGNTVYVTVDNFRRYANAQGFFCYAHNGNVQVNNSNTVVTANYTRYVTAKIGLNIRRSPNGTIIGSYRYGTAVTVLGTSGNWSRTNLGWVSSTYLSGGISNTYVNTSSNGTIKKLARACYLYSNSNLSGTAYSYKANTTITILQHVSSNVDRVRVNLTGRIAYINTNNYTNVVISKSKSTAVGQYRRFKSNTYLYSNSNLTGTRYFYLPLTQVKIIRHISSNVDYIYIVKTGRYAYVNVNSYK